MPRDRSGKREWLEPRNNGEEPMARKFNEAKDFIAGADNLAVALQMAVDNIFDGATDFRQMHRLAALDAVIDAE
jgi:hypothetical protein